MKLEPTEARQYWRRTHATSANDLIAVCHPDKPLYYNRFEDWTQRYALRKAARKLDLRGKSLLDIGCGRGRWLRFFQENYSMETTGIDLSHHAVQVCRSHDLTACEGSITDLPFPSAHFNVVSSITVLLHLPPDAKAQAIQEIERVLQPGGVAILIESTWADPAPHVFGLSVEEWQSLFAQSGMRLTHCSGHCFFYFRARMHPPLPIRVWDAVGTLLDYPLELALMNVYSGRRSRASFQHVMVFEK